jgi:hypothetical protein
MFFAPKTQNTIIHKTILLLALLMLFKLFMMGFRGEKEKVGEKKKFLR